MAKRRTNNGTNYQHQSEERAQDETALVHSPVVSVVVFAEAIGTILSPSASGSKLANFFDTSATWDMGDDYRTDRFSENYYRHYWGMHKGGLVLGTFFGLVLVVSAVVGAAFCHVDTVL